jgi:ParB/RepB/Spo0J family partition protein
MAISTDVAQGLRLERIQVPANVRELDPEHVDALARSIRLQGMLVPVVVRPADEAFELVAGFHRVAAARSLGLVEVPAVVRDAETEDADRAVENITRKQLNPYEEARAVKAMLDRGLTEDGAAQALGWAKARVTARVKVLELPERAQQLVGNGLIPLGAVDQLRAIGAAAPGLLDAVLAFIDDGNEWAAERLAREPGWVLDSAIRHGRGKTFAAYLHDVSPHHIAELRLGKRAEARLAEAERLHKQLDRYAYGPPQIRFSETRHRPGPRGRGPHRVRAGTPNASTGRSTASSSRARSSAPSTSWQPGPPRRPSSRGATGALASRPPTRSRSPGANATGG